MGTLQQITLGAACVGGAFLLGHYLNNQSPANAPFESTSVEAVTTDQPKGGLGGLLERREQTAMLPNFRTQSSLGFDFEKDVELPPPNQLDITPNNTSSALEKANDSEQHIEIEVPDFSALAAQFKGTLLELPPLDHKSGNRRIASTESSRPHDKQLLTNDGLNNRPDRRSGISQVENNHRVLSPHVPENENGQIPTIQLTINPPTNETDSTAMSAVQLFDQPFETSFQLEDFSPKLRGDEGVAALTTTSSGTHQNSAGGAIGSSILEYQQPISNIATQAHPNAVISYNDPFPSQISHQQAILNDSNRLVGAESSSMEPSPRIETAGRRMAETWQPRNQENNSSNRDHNAGGIVTKEDSRSRTLPLGLNEEDRTRLSRLNVTQNQRSDVSATRFENYETRMGDSLTSISTRFYGKPDYYLDIYLANRNQLRNPADVPSGITLRIPIYD